MQPPEYICSHCKKVYDRYSSWYSHVRNRHKPAPAKRCIKCKASFKSNQAMHSHYYRRHVMDSIKEEEEPISYEYPPPQEKKPTENKPVVASLPVVSFADSPWAT